MEKTPYLKKETVKPDPGGINEMEKDYSELIDLAVHDLDAPLRKLTLMLAMLTNKLPADQELQSYASRIIGCIDHMRSLIDDLSVLGRVGMDGMEFNACNIDSVVQDSLQALPIAIKQRQAIITTDNLPVVEGDLNQLTLLFKHLLENGIKFHDQGKSPRIHIDSAVLTSHQKIEHRLDDDRLYYRIEIADDGIGFKDENAEKIFHPFVRLHGKAQFAGNGVGLAICKKIMNNHHGIIYAQGRENEGARFVLILPESH